jgi:alpha-D-ribose 1-methylphosphonate 5-triphosphate synthase subunit PhnI
MAATQAHTLEALDRRIVEAEAQITALTAVVLGLAKAGCDTTEAAALLRDYRTSLPNRRRQRWAIPARGRTVP